MFQSVVPRHDLPHVIVVGGGASGVLLAVHLLHRPSSRFRVTLLEKRADIGRGIAYCTSNPEHLLNVRAANMSAFPEQPDHFWRWLCARNIGERDVNKAPALHASFHFAPRRVYGDYLADLVAPLLAKPGGSSGLHVIRGECVGISETSRHAAIHLEDGRHLWGDFVILATGHERSKNLNEFWVDPWGDPSRPQIASEDRILVLGTGLTMIDYVLSLLWTGHRGQIIAMSRRGLLPTVHRHVAPLTVPMEDVPVGQCAVVLLRWLRQRVKAHVARGGDWRSVIDGLRPFTQKIWLELPLASKQQFLQHARAWWDVHRHRMAPEIGHRIRSEIAVGALTIVAGKIVSVEPNGRGAVVHYRRRGGRAIETIQVSKIVDCTGITTDPSQSTNPALRSLFEHGLGRADPSRIGLDVTTECAIVNRSGVPSKRLFAIGPLSRAAFWEVVAVPDIRTQCAELATRLAHATQSADAAAPPF